MTREVNVDYVPLAERVVRNEDIFCSLLFDNTNRTLRVVDFRGGNFQSKHEYLERVLMQEGMRKIFTLIERDDINGWQRVGYHREGAIPGYYKRSDAYVMSRIYDAEYDAKAPQGEEAPENKTLLNDVKVAGKKLADTRDPSILVKQVGDAEAFEALKEEIARSGEKQKKTTAVKTTKPAKAPKTKKAKKPSPENRLGAELKGLIFPQFSREVEYYHFLVQNRRTKQLNIISTEYQDCFGNAKVHFCLSPEGKTEQNLAKAGLSQAIDQLMEAGAVSIFATVLADNTTLNGIYNAMGFRNTGWLNRQVVTSEGPQDVILWTKKLI